MVWRGLTTREKIIAVVAGIIAVAATIGAVASSGSTAVVFALIALVTGAASGSILISRYQAFLKGGGIFCRECGVRISYTDLAEAFFVSGRFGDLPTEFRTYAVCQKGHQTEVDWTAALYQMGNHLIAPAWKAKGTASALEHSKHPKNKTKGERERAFASKAIPLIRKSDPGEYRKLSADEMRALFARFANRPWPKDNREDLYEVLALAEAYGQLLASKHP